MIDHYAEQVYAAVLDKVIGGNLGFQNGTAS